MAKINFMLYLALVAVGLSCVAALSEEEMQLFRQKVGPSLKECTAKYQTTVQELAALRKAGRDNEVNPCIVTCTFHKLGITTEDAKLLPAEASAYMRGYVKDPVYLQKADNAIIVCTGLNDIEIPGGVCARGDQLRKCFQENEAWFF